MVSVNSDQQEGLSSGHGSSRRDRAVMLGYLGGRVAEYLLVLAKNLGARAEPAWWLNLQAHPAAIVHLAGSPRRSVSARAAGGAERERLWALWRTVETTWTARRSQVDADRSRRPGPELHTIAPGRRPSLLQCPEHRVEGLCAPNHCGARLEW